MDNSIKFWFTGFEKGLDSMEKSQQEVFLHECGKNCIEQRALKYYKKIFDDVNGDLDLFFIKLNEIAGVRTEIIESEKFYKLFFESCVCPLYTSGYVKSPTLCECSKQSVLHVMNSFWYKKKFDVKLCSSVLHGNKECETIIMIK